MEYSIRRAKCTSPTTVLSEIVDIPPSVHVNARPPVLDDVSNQEDSYFIQYD